MNERNKNILLFKGIAIFSVVFAHCHNNISMSLVEEILNQITINIGTIGVPIFFVCSGYLFHKKPFLLFWQKKVPMIEAWIFTGSLVWGYEVVRKGLDYANYVEWLLGIGTYLWYMPTLFLIWFIFELINEKYLIHATCVFLFIYISVIEILEVKKFDVPFLRNVICFIPFFAIGYLIQKKKDILRKIIEKCSIWVPLIILVGGIVYNQNKLIYGCRMFLLIALSIIFLIYRVFNSLKKDGKLSRGLMQLGENSYAIYLLHMPLAGAATNIFSRFSISRMLVLFYPIAVCLTVNYFCELAKKRIRYKWILRLVGIV